MKYETRRLVPGPRAMQEHNALLFSRAEKAEGNNTVIVILDNSSLDDIIQVSRLW